MEIRHTEKKDFHTLMHIYHHAQRMMKKNGNPNQWGRHWPTKEIVKKDIENGLSYACVEQGKIVGVFAYIEGEDPTYKTIEGKWLNDHPYGTIHRIASLNKVKGILRAAVNFGLDKQKDVRIDTHKDNDIVRHTVLSLGFAYTGIIHLENGDPRLAYQLPYEVHGQ